LILDTTPPAITAQPVNRVAYAGKATIFNVTATGALPLNYQWRKDGLGINGAAGSSLLITNLQITNNGSYSVIVTNLYGSVTSSFATLIVNTGTPPRIAIFGAETVSALISDVFAKIIATGSFATNDIDVFSPSTNTPSLAALDLYGAVLIWSDSQF